MLVLMPWHCFQHPEMSLELEVARKGKPCQRKTKDLAIPGLTPYISGAQTFCPMGWMSSAWSLCWWA